MIIGYSMIGANIFRPPTSPIANVSYVELKNAVIDELHIKNTKYSSAEMDNWGLGTALLAKFDGDLEAGNISASENPIKTIRVKRRNIENPSAVTVADIPFNPDPTLIVFDDYLAVSSRNYEYHIVPVDIAGIEGIINSVSVAPVFEGWWIVDLDEPEKYTFQFLYNLEDVTITTEEDRVELKTFRKYPIVRYGKTRYKKGTLAGIFIPEGINVRKHIEKFDEMLTRHKPYLLKDKYGRGFLVDISEPQETIQARLAGLSKLQVNWTEVGKYND